jgi:hypothetical protein
MRLIPLEIGQIDMHIGTVTGDDKTRRFPIPSWLIELESVTVELTGDSVYFESMLDQMQVPTIGGERSQDQKHDSMRYLASLRDDGCRLLYGQDLQQFAALPAEGMR